MIENYMAYRDMVFINKRITKTRFSRMLVLFCGVNSSGKSVLFGFSMLTKDDDESFDYALVHFKKALAEECAPRLFIIERST